MQNYFMVYVNDSQVRNSLTLTPMQSGNSLNTSCREPCLHFYVNNFHHMELEHFIWVMDVLKNAL